jgi:hypothetical protein
MIRASYFAGSLGARVAALLQVSAGRGQPALPRHRRGLFKRNARAAAKSRSAGR